MEPLSALVVDDHPICRFAAEAALVAVHPDATIVHAATMAEAVARAGAADLILLDLGLPDMRGLAALLTMKAANDAAPVLVVSANEEAGMAALCRSVGAAGFVSKLASLDVLQAAISTVLAGGTAFPEVDPGEHTRRLAERMNSLSPAERRVIAGMSDGSLNKQIAHAIGLSEVTVKQHVKAILRKLGVTNRTQAVLLLQTYEPNGNTN